MASEEHIRHTFDDEPGLRRRKAGKGFIYIDPRGRSVDAATRRRIEKLVIPPAWTDVWICPDPRGHIQAVGRDARGRKQYIYHPGWREWREQTKFQHMLDFAVRLPRLRERVARDLADRRLTQPTVLASAVRVLERTLMRVGNDEYARQNQSFGLTTLLSEHIEREGSRVRFSFRGKHGKQFEAELADRRVAAVLRRMEGLPGQHLFQFVDEAGEPHRITSDDVNAYIREAMGGEFTAKDFRTWAATVLAVIELLQFEETESPSVLKRNAAHAMRRVADRLGNTPAVARSSYVHPEVLASYMDGTLARLSLPNGDEENGNALLASEKVVLRFLRKRMKQATGERQPSGFGHQLRESMAERAGA